MNRSCRLNFPCLAVLLSLVGALPGSLHGQTPSQPAAPSLDRDTLNFSMEQIENDARIFEQDLQAQLADLTAQAAQIAKEVEMSSPELSKLRDLSAKFDDRRQELIERAQEMGERAEEMSTRVEELAAEATQKVQEKGEEIFSSTPGIFVSSTDDGGGWLGIEIGEVTPEKARDLKLSSARGVIVMDVEPDGPAAKAGLKENDVITHYDGQTVMGTVQFRRLVRETPPGRSVALAISRDGNTQNISVELGDRGAYFERKMKGKMRDFEGMQMPPLPDVSDGDMPEPPNRHVMGMMDWRTPVLGISAEDLTRQLGAFFGAPDDGGILVREVRSGTPAEEAGLKAGDVIVKVGDQPVRSLAELRDQLREKSAQKTVNLGILRKGAPMTVSVAIELPRPMEPMHRVHRSES
ncbi:MAG: PDZ domain-containing protein [Candidatus Acidiferrales bacterium]